MGRSLEASDRQIGPPEFCKKWVSTIHMTQKAISIGQTFWSCRAKQISPAAGTICLVDAYMSDIENKVLLEIP